MSMFPHTVTLYQPSLVTDPDTLAETVINRITILHGVLLDAEQSRSFHGELPVSSDKVTLYVPFTVEGMPAGLRPDGKAFFIKGEVVEPDLSAQELERIYPHVYTVASVKEFDFGGLPHWEIGGK